MLYSWYILTRETSRHSRRPAHPLDDPLDRPEWRGLDRLFLLAARLKAVRARHRSQAEQVPGPLAVARRS